MQTSTFKKMHFLSVCVEFVTLACFYLHIWWCNIVAMLAFPPTSYLISSAAHIICLPNTKVGEKYELLVKVQKSESVKSATICEKI